ncbi:aprataxin-like protein [Naganishia albida]|nr:aprataxin-like protein [Naganishia albida]
MHALDALTQYAFARRPDRDIPSDVYLLHDPHTVTVFDKFPKAKYHFLVLPRIPFVDGSATEASDADTQSDSNSSTESTSSAVHPAISANALASLHALLSTTSSAISLRILRMLQQTSLEVVEMVKDEMLKTEGFEWGIEVGFHAVPSMRTLHLHVISTDFVSPSLKVKKHYTSFHPTFGFFLPLESVIQSLDKHATSNAPTFDIEKYSRPNGPKSWEPILKGDLACWRCGQMFGNMPMLKKHLDEEWAKLKSVATRTKKAADSR